MKKMVYSFLPSATEMVYALGLQDQLVAVTQECDYPPEARSKPVVVRSLIDPSSASQHDIDQHVVHSLTDGHGLYTIDRSVLLREKPDVVITQELCDVCSVSLRDVLATVSDLARDCEVISLKPRGLYGVLDDIVTVGRACGAEGKAEELVASLKGRIETVRGRTSGLPRPRVFCAEWFDPPFAPGHWVPEMVAIAGGREGLGRAGEPSRKVAWEEILDYDPESLILMPCGFDAARTLRDVHLLSGRRGWGSITAVREGRVFATNGSAYYSRPGPRLVDGLELMARMIHPEVFGAELPHEAARRVELSAVPHADEAPSSDRR